LGFFDFSLRINGFKIHEAEKFIASIHALNEDDFSAYIEAQKERILQHHLTTNLFYKKLTLDFDCSQWETLPILTKKDLQQPLENRLAEGFSKGQVYVNKTSGSSGDPFIFAKDKWSHALTWAIIKHRFSWYNIDFNTSKQARFFGIPLDRKNYYKERLKDWFSNRYRFSIFDLSEASFEFCLNKFKKTAFKYINGYTSPIVQFAKFLQDKNIVLKTVCPSLDFCMVTSEMLFDSDKQLMEHQFGIPVINEYGASELDLIAFEDPKGDFILNSETLFVEIVDASGKVVPNGQEGRIVITSLFNIAHPFIRYDIGDIGVIAEHSTSKRPVLKKLIGRTNDIAILPSGKKAAGLTFYYITKSIIEDDGNVKEFVIEQQKKALFHVLYVSSKALTDAKKITITKAMIDYLEEGVNITFERRDHLDRSASGKLKQFISYLTSN